MGSFPKPISNEGSNSSFQCGILNMPLKMGPLWICHSWIRFQFVFRLNIHLSFIGYDTMLDTYGVLSQNPLTMRDAIHVFYKDCVVSDVGLTPCPLKTSTKSRSTWRLQLHHPLWKLVGEAATSFFKLSFELCLFVSERTHCLIYYNHVHYNYLLDMPIHSWKFRELICTFHS